MKSSLRSMLTDGGSHLVMEAHNGLSARVVEDEGFSAIWASGLSISSALGFRDANEASMHEMLCVLAQMRHAASTPILFDGDSGYGDFNNFRLLVRRLERAGIDGVVLEDKPFPKRNSLLHDGHELAPIPEVCGKIRAAKEMQRNPEFCIIARTEAFIANLGLDAALARAEAYRDAGADGIFIHSRKSTPVEILDFARAWGKKAPLVIAPTTYGDCDSRVFAGTGISLYICANQNLRASVAAMQGTCRQIIKNTGIHDIEPRLAPLSELHRLFDYKELTQAEGRFSP
jgi:phosphoenolpyruvate phosphomutase